MKNFEILAHEETTLGLLCLRRRRTLTEPQQWVTEVTLNHEFLMSSLHTCSETLLASVSLSQLSGSGLRVLVGGLGLGYTAKAALDCDRVGHVDVVEYLPEVVRWLRQGLVPLADELNAEKRLRILEADIFQRLLSPPDEARYDAILIDIDHSPEDTLSNHVNDFYQASGLRKASSHLNQGGVLALWSYDQHTPLLDAMREVFADATAHPVPYYNSHVHESFTDWLYIGKTQ